MGINTVRPTRLHALKWMSALALLLLTTSAFACNVPVFRYALERWKSDPYELVIINSHEVSPADRQVIDSLSANLKVSFEKQGKGESAHVQLRTRFGDRHLMAWQGSLDELATAPLLQSPVRTELAGRLLAGDSVVWLLVRSNDDDRTDAIRKLLTGSFATLAQRVSLPDGIGVPGSELYSEIPLLMKFSLIEIDPADEQEVVLFQLLTSIQSESYSAGEPLLVPVFGRGRALEVIPGKIMTESLIEDLTLFLSGACSCQVKERNPGFDLPMSVNWESELFGEDGESPPESSSTEPSGTPRTLTIPPGRKTSTR